MMFFKFVKRILFFLQSKEGVAIVETSFILPFLIFILIFFIEIFLYQQARHSVIMIANACACDFSISGRTNTFNTHIAKFPNIALGADDLSSLQSKLRYYIHLNASVDDMMIYPLFFDNDGDGEFTPSNDKLLYDKFANTVNPIMYIGINSWSIYGKKSKVSYDNEFCYFEAADLAKRNLYDKKIRYGVIVFVYKFKFIFPLFRNLITTANKKLDFIPVIGVSSVIRNY